MKIHHATRTKAAKFKINMYIVEGHVVASDRDGKELASGLQGNKVLEDAITKLTGKPAKGKSRTAAEVLAGKPVLKRVRKASTPKVEDDETGEESDGDEGQSRSIVKAKYRALYKPHKDRSGDDLSHKVNQHVSREDDAGGMKVDLMALRKFAKANGTWVEGYASLKSRTGGWNSGQAVMNTNNRLRAKIRQGKKAGEEFEIKWV